jgi:hypothetical protein
MPELQRIGKKGAATRISIAVRDLQQHADRQYYLKVVEVLRDLESNSEAPGRYWEQPNSNYLVDRLPDRLQLCRQCYEAQQIAPDDLFEVQTEDSATPQPRLRGETAVCSLCLNQVYETILA